MTEVDLVVVEVVDGVLGVVFDVVAVQHSEDLQKPSAAVVEVDLT